MSSCDITKQDVRKAILDEINMSLYEGRYTFSRLNDSMWKIANQRETQGKSKAGTREQAIEIAKEVQERVFKLFEGNVLVEIDIPYDTTLHISMYARIKPIYIDNVFFRTNQERRKLEPPHVFYFDEALHQQEIFEEQQNGEIKTSSPSSLVKEGIFELFESNPELANSVYSAMGFGDKANVILPIGTSGSGKSTFIKSLPQDNLVVISPDEMRVEFTGDINNKSKDKEIYQEAAKRAVKAVKEGKQVVFDTTNLTKDKRRPFIDVIKKALPNANIQYKLMELNPELAKQRIKAQIARGENRANVPDSTIDRHAESYKEMLEDIKSEDISNFDTEQDIEEFKEFVGGKQSNNTNTLFGLDTQNQEKLEFHINTLNVVGQFLENIGIEQRLVPEFLLQNGNVVEGAIAAANFIDGTVDIINDIEKRPSAWNKLPEEAAHFWYRLLDTNSPLKDALLTASLTDRKEEELRNSLYGKTYEGVKVVGKLTLDSQGNVTSKPALSAIREEAIGQLIAEAIKRIETKNGSTADYSFLKKFIDWINSTIGAFKNTTRDPFEVAAMKILSSDMSDLMTWGEYRKLNNIVNFSDVLTEQSIAPIDYTLIEDIGSIQTGFKNTSDEILVGQYFSSKIESKKSSPIFETQQELDNWVSANVPEHDQRQKAIIQEVKDNQVFFDRLLNKSFRKKSKFLPKTLRKYFQIIDTQNFNSLGEWNISSELQQITKKLSEEEKKQIVETNGYTNIAPTLKVLPDLLQKYKKNPIVLYESIKIDGAKKQELSILNGIKDMIKLENPNLKTITAEEFVAEAHNWLETNYLLGFANEKSYLSYRTDQTFTHISDRQTNEDVVNLTDEEIQRLSFTERQRIANIVGLTKQNPDVYHNKVSLRFNDMYHLKSGHFDKSPSAWGNLTYFYTGKNKWKDAVLLHEIQNDNIEFLRDFKAEKVDLETSLGRYLQQLTSDLLDNITQIESGGKRIQKIHDVNPPKQHLQLNYQLQQLVSLPTQQGLTQLKQNLNEKIELYKSDNSVRNNPEKAQEEIEKAYSQKRKFADFQKRGGIKSLLTSNDLMDLKEILNELNTGIIMTDGEYLPEENQYEPGYETIRDLKQKKQDFKIKSSSIISKINTKFKEMYGEDAPIITLNAPAKPLPKAQRRGRVVNAGTAGEMRIGNASQDLNESVYFLIAFSEQQINKRLSKTIEESKKNYIVARNATNANNFNVSLNKITQEQYDNLIENYRYNQDLLNRLIDEQAQKDIQEESIDVLKLSDEEIIKDITGEFEEPNEIDGTAGSGFKYKNMYLSTNSTTKEEAIQEIRDRFDPNSQKIKEQTKYENLKQAALEKKEELEKNYGKIEDEVKQTLEVEMNYFTPLVHHLIQKHINQYGKDFPMYFSGYNITRLTQGNDRTALIYAGKDEVNIVNKSLFNLNGKEYLLKDGVYRVKSNSEVSDSSGYWKGYETINQQQYEKAYQQATEQRAKEIKFEAAKQIGLIPTVVIPNKNQFEVEGYEYRIIQGISGKYRVNKKGDFRTEKVINATEYNKAYEKILPKEVSLEEGIKKLNEYKKQSKQNLDRVINTIMNISNSKPIETGAIYNAMTQISGIKLIWQNEIKGLKNNVGGYLVDLTNYNYNTPVLYGLSSKNTNQNITNSETSSDIQLSILYQENNCK